MKISEGKGIGRSRHKYSGCLLLTVLFVCFFSRVTAAQQELQFGRHPPLRMCSVLNDRELYAQSAVLLDGDTGRVLFGKNENERLPMASTTKIMTCILVLEQMDLQQICTVSGNAAAAPAVHLGAAAGTEFYCGDLLYSLMLESHNDTAVVLAEAMSGSVENFAGRMNEKARQIGLTQTHFVTASGLDDPGHYTTAKELGLLLRYCIRESPKRKEFLTITRTESFQFSDCTGLRQYAVYNHNAFLHMMEGALTGKTGFTGNAGYCYVGALEKDGRLLIVALLACGWPGNRSYKWSDTRKLMNYGLENYQMQELSLPPLPCTEIPVAEGCYDWRQEEQAYTGISCPDAPESVYRLAAQGESILQRLQLEKELTAPVGKDTLCGQVSYWLKEVCIGTYPLYASKEIAKLDYSWYCSYVLHHLIPAYER